MNGLLIMRGVRLMDLPLHEGLDVIYAVALEGRDDKGRMKMQADLDRPTPAQVERASNDMWWNHEAEAEAFAAAERQWGGGMFG